MSMLFHRPRGLLGHRIRALWVYDVTRRTRERRLPTGEAQAILHLDGRGAPQLSGPSAASFDIGGHPGRVLGVVFRAGGLRPYIDRPAAEVADQHVPLTDVAPWAHRLLDAAAEAPDPMRAIGAAAQVLSRAATPRDRSVDALVTGVEHHLVRDVAQDSGLSSAQLRELFAEHVGLTPKRYARVRRVQRALPSLRNGTDLAEVAHRGGWLDHAHFTRDFRKVTGVTPSEWRRRVGRWDNHLFVQAA